MTVRDLMIRLEALRGQVADPDAVHVVVDDGCEGHMFGAGAVRLDGDSLVIDLTE